MRMIKSFRSKALKQLYEQGIESKVHASHREKAKDILALLDSARTPDDLKLPGLRLDLHPLKGSRRGSWAMTVKQNWRVTFRFDGEDVFDVDYEDYH
jgi:toxin HigB-1